MKLRYSASTTINVPARGGHSMSPVYIMRRTCAPQNVLSSAAFGTSDVDVSLWEKPTHFIISTHRATLVESDIQHRMMFATALFVKMLGHVYEMGLFVRSCYTRLTLASGSSYRGSLCAFHLKVVVCWNMSGMSPLNQFALLVISGYVVASLGAIIVYVVNHRKP